MPLNNVNGINGRLPVLLRWLKESAPDIVCLQELKAPQERFPLKEIEKAGYGAVWHGQKSWNGVTILARGAEHKSLSSHWQLAASDFLSGRDHITTNNSQIVERALTAQN